ncbi:MAG: hypothetical protein D6775_02625 [Caldilineae bacterium]|nr:MAG: hypothetical protein D6775_02625 [Caldilineae bacterium]
MVDKKLKYVVIVVVPLLALLLLAAPITATGGPDDHLKADGVYPTADDNRLEVGVWYASDYPPAGSGGSDLPATRPDALGLVNTLTSDCRLRILGICIWSWPTPKWTRRFVFANGAAWEQDWKRADAPGGGTENLYVDTVDLAYFAGHGWTGGFLFGVGGRDHDDPYLTYGDARHAWGDRDLDWVGLAACNVLADAHRRDWANTMQGLRLLMGFVTTMADVPHGEKLGRYIRLNHTMTQAWFRAADDLQPQGKIARVLAEENWMFNDRWYNHKSTDYYDNIYWWWTHHVGSEPARAVPEQLDQMPVFMVQPLSLDEANREWDTLVASTGITDTGYVTETTFIASFGPDIVQQGGQIRVSESGQLIMDEQNGLFNYMNSSDLWTYPETEAASIGAMRTINQDTARQIADQWLQEAGLMPADASFYEVVPETVAQGSNEGGLDGLEEVMQEQTLSHQVIYSRLVTAEVPVNGGESTQAVTFSVMGPGSKLKVYVAPQVAATLSGKRLLQAAVDGAVGGYRRVQPPAAGQSTDTPAFVPIIPREKAEIFVTYLNPDKQPELEMMFGLSPIPFPNLVSREVVSHTLGYWEGPMGWSQDMLIPVHIFELNNQLEDGSTVPSTAYIPANPQFMAPIAKIIRKETAGGDPIPDGVRVGDELVFEAFDATGTLAQAGYPAALDFSPGSGDYVYNWYVDSVAPENKVGSGRVLHYTVAAASTLREGAGTHDLILEVLDVGTNRQPDRSYSRYSITVLPPAFLPLVLH